jgi:pleiotropic regulator 1
MLMFPENHNIGVDCRSAGGLLSGSSAVVEYKAPVSSALSTTTGSGPAQFGTSAIVRRRATQVPKPKWHAPWKLKRVIAGHLGWVRSVAVDPTNDWFVTGSADRTIKVWDLASGQLKLTLTGHINTIRGLEVSPRHPYLFSAAEDKKVLCKEDPSPSLFSQAAECLLTRVHVCCCTVGWDLETNKVIRSYHGHLSGVFSLKVHPTLDILMTGGRDAVTRVRTVRHTSFI